VTPVTTWKKHAPLWIAAFLCLLASGCRQANEPTVSLVSSEEISRLLEQAETVEPMAEPVVEEYAYEGGMTVVCRQALRLKGGGVGSVGVVHCCTGSCKNDPDRSGPCTATGCRTGGPKCGTFTCSGGCVEDMACKSCDKGLMIRW
jgi:hypothetical protein